MESETQNSSNLQHPGGIQHGISIVKAMSKQMPPTPGIYKMLSQDGSLLYVGKAKNLPKRVISYSRLDQMPNRLRRMVSQIDKIEYEITKTEAEALLLEASLIRNLKPRFNIALRDDKSFPYIFLDTKHDYPRITKFRGSPKNKLDYWGPFASASAVNDTIVEIQKIFNIRPCSNSYFASRSRPCLEYQIHRCSAPCVGKISKEEYGNSIKEAKKFLNGNSNTIHKLLQERMWKHSENQEYEKAASIRDKIDLLNQIQNRNTFSNTNVNFADVIGLIRRQEEVCIQVLMIRNSQSFGSKTYFPQNVQDMPDAEIMHNFLGQFYQSRKPAEEIIMNVLPIESALLKESIDKLHTLSGRFKVEFIIPKKNNTKSMRDKDDILEFVCENAKEALLRKMSSSKNISEKLSKIASLFGITNTIKRVEIYDNSHIFGKHAIGGYVVLTDEGFKRSEYRQYNIRLNQPQSGGDDYSMLTETLTRRIKRLDACNYPDLLLIDGGKGHLSIASKILENCGIKDIVIVAISKGVDRNAGREFFHTLNKESFQLPVHDEKLRFLQMMRNEAHNFAITQHRKKREKSITRSALEDIPSIGDSRKKELLQHFGSLEKIKQASVYDLQRVSGISKKLAEIIYNYLHFNSNIS